MDTHDRNRRYSINDISDINSPSQNIIKKYVYVNILLFILKRLVVILVKISINVSMSNSGFCYLFGVPVEVYLFLHIFVLSAFFGIYKRNILHRGKKRKQAVSLYFSGSRSGSHHTKSYLFFYGNLPHYLSLFFF